MNTKGWRYYNHAAVPNCAPHEQPDLTPIYDGTIWKKSAWDGGRVPLFARWTEDFDCGYETSWWYTIQDKPLDIMDLKKRHRKRITRGIKNFDCRRIDPREYAQQMAEITLKAWETYPKAYRPSESKEELIEKYRKWDYITYGAFDRNDGSLCAFHGTNNCGSYYVMAQGKANPEIERQGRQVNAALIYTYVMDICEEYEKGKYLSNGQRNLNHKTNFNEDLCNYYGFRKAYCKLKIAYNPKIKWLISISYPFRKIFLKLDKIKVFHNLNGVLKMEEIVRNE